MPKNGFVMRFFGYVQLPVGVVGAERSIQLSYGRIYTVYRCRQYNSTYLRRGQVLFEILGMKSAFRFSHNTIIYKSVQDPRSRAKNAAELEEEKKEEKT